MSGLTRVYGRLDGLSARRIIGIDIVTVLRDNRIMTTTPSDRTWSALAADVTHYGDMLHSATRLRLSEYHALVARYERAKQALYDYEQQRGI